MWVVDFDEKEGYFEKNDVVEECIEKNEIR
jgi:hypothetical protein